MKFIDNLLEVLKTKYEIDLSAALINVQKAIQSGQLLDNPDMLLALVLLGLAGFIVISCGIMLLFGRSQPGASSDLYSLDARIRTLEMTVSDQRNLILVLKNQGKADFGYLKQEIKDLNLAIEEIEYGQSSVKQQLKAV